MSPFAGWAVVAGLVVVAGWEGGPGRAGWLVARWWGCSRNSHEWQSGDRRYLSEGSMALLKPNSDTAVIAAIDGGD